MLECSRSIRHFRVYIIFHSIPLILWMWFGECVLRRWMAHFGSIEKHSSIRAFHGWHFFGPRPTRPDSLRNDPRPIWRRPELDVTLRKGYGVHILVHRELYGQIRVRMPVSVLTGYPPWALSRARQVAYIVTCTKKSAYHSHKWGWISLQLSG